MEIEFPKVLSAVVAPDAAARAEGDVIVDFVADDQGAVPAIVGAPVASVLRGLHVAGLGQQVIDGNAAQGFGRKGDHWRARLKASRPGGNFSIDEVGEVGRGIFGRGRLPSVPETVFGTQLVADQVAVNLDFGRDLNAEAVRCAGERLHGE